MQNPALFAKITFIFSQTTRLQFYLSLKMFRMLSILNNCGQPWQKKLHTNTIAEELKLPEYYLMYYQV